LFRTKKLPESAILGDIFTRCVDEKDGAGNVRLTNEAQCIIKRFLPDIVSIVNTIKSNRMEPYIESMHKNICAKCESVNPDGSCELRARADCCLDRYFPLIVEVIEEVNGRSLPS
jgi:hypothetical protein